MSITAADIDHLVDVHLVFQAAEPRRHACHVCDRGAIAAGSLPRQNRKGKPGIWACPDHFERIRCALDDCRRTHRGTPGEEWICAEHWRRYCPPRSLRRRAYHAFFRRAKTVGWTDDSARQYWRFWDTMVAVVQAEHARGVVDMTEINKLFGWSDYDG
jgi:hypothetical protein